MTSPGDVFARAMLRHAPGGSLGVAVSGGSDSTALLLLTADWAVAQGRIIEAATLDHRLRPSSAAEAAGVARLAGRLSLRHETLVWKDGPGATGNLQAAARTARRRLLAAWARRRGLDAVLLGHTEDDLAETFLMRLARGSGVDGLAAMAPVFEAEGVTWIRPLLSENRASLRSWLEERGETWTEDESNADRRFQRIRARDALAALAPLGVDRTAIVGTAERMARARIALDTHTADLAAAARTPGAAGEIVIDRAQLAAAPEEIGLRLLADALREIGGSPYRPRFEGLERAYRAAVGGQCPGISLAGCLIRGTDGAVILCREPSAVAPPVPAAASCLWDGRWQVALSDWPGGAEIGALGEAGLAALADAPRPDAWDAAPRPARLTTPALWHRGRLLAAPLAGHSDPSLRNPTGMSARPAQFAREAHGRALDT